jgi:hypothetical protein
MTNIENYLAGIKNPSPGIESGFLASVESVYIARVESVPRPIIVNAPATWAESVYILRATILVLRFY